MPDHRRSRQRMFYIVPTIGIAAVVLVYLWAYCATGMRVTGPAERRIYQHEWQGRLFSPAVKVESVIRQKPITAEWRLDSSFP
jgi:hypothetical protein